MKSFFSDRLIPTKDLSYFVPEKGTDYRLLVSRPTALILRTTFPLGCGMKERYREIGYEHAHESMYIGETIIMFDFNRLTDERNKLMALYEKDRHFLFNLAKRCENEGNALMKHSFTILKKDLAKLSTDRLCEIFEECMKMILDYDIYILMPHSIQKFLEDGMDSELAKHNLSPELSAKYKAALSTPIRSNEGFYEQKDILRIAAEYEKKGLADGVKRKIEKHVFEFGHIGSKYGVGKTWNYDDVLERVMFLARSEPEKKLSDLLEYNKAVDKDVADALKVLHASKEFKDFVKLTREFIYMRTLRTDVMSGAFVNLMPLMFEIGRRNGYSEEEILRCLPHEIAELKLPSKEELKDRNSLSFRCKDGKIYYIQGKDSLKIERKYLKSTKEKANSKAKEVKGTIANKGIARGTARIVIDSTEIGKIKSGDILIAPMTTPNFVPAMEKAAAFVTDEGGILCHAAIVSREMKKPCITSTKVATQVLKDGDIVEVDADNGVVRKIK
jgi:phosphohistidine swiveling domain-containing protein